MKKVIYSLGFLALATGIVTFSSCSKDPAPAPVVEQEEFDHALIQLIRLNPDGSQTSDTTSVNFDKQGTPTPQQTILSNGTKYRMLITLSLHGESINNEIIEEGTEHKFFLNPSQAGLLDYTYSDADSDGRGIGLDGKLSVTGTGAFDVKLVLRHALDKSKPEAQAWNSTTYSSAGGEDDLNVTFGLKTQ